LLLLCCQVKNLLVDEPVLIDVPTFEALIVFYTQPITVIAKRKIQVKIGLIKIEGAVVTYHINIGYRIINPESAVSK
jgi:hypothetical protein